MQWQRHGSGGKPQNFDTIWGFREREACESRKVREQRTEIDGLKKELALEQSKRRIAEADAAEMPAKRFRSLLGGAASASQLDLTQDLDIRHNASPKMLRVH